MYYENVICYLIDNRHSLTNQCKEAKMSEEQLAKALEGYDFAALKAIATQTSYSIFKETIISIDGEDKFKEYEKLAAEHFMELGEAEGKYIKAVEEGKKVGYSALHIKAAEEGKNAGCSALENVDYGV